MITWLVDVLWSSSSMTGWSIQMFWGAIVSLMCRFRGNFYNGGANRRQDVLHATLQLCRTPSRSTDDPFEFKLSVARCDSIVELRGD
jgi:hypothetical protein